MNDFKFLDSFWMHMHTRQQSDLKLLLMGKLSNCIDSTTKQARTDAASGTESVALNR